MAEEKSHVTIQFRSNTDQFSFSGVLDLMKKINTRKMERKKIVTKRSKIQYKKGITNKMYFDNIEQCFIYHFDL